MERLEIKLRDKEGEIKGKGYQRVYTLTLKGLENSFEGYQVYQESKNNGPVNEALENLKRDGIACENIIIAQSCTTGEYLILYKNSGKDQTYGNRRIKIGGKYKYEIN